MVRYSWVVLASLTACGGSTEIGDNPSGQAPPWVQGSGGEAGARGFGDSSPLGDCQSSGFLPSQANGRPCNWIINDRCYDTREDACECECPRDEGDVFCVSGPDEGDDAHNPVSCEAVDS